MDWELGKRGWVPLKIIKLCSVYFWWDFKQDLVSDFLFWKDCCGSNLRVKLKPHNMNTIQSVVPRSYCISYASWVFLKTHIWGPCCRCTDSEFTKIEPEVWNVECPQIVNNAAHPALENTACGNYYFSRLK